jgi:hypothetical protein
MITQPPVPAALVGRFAASVFDFGSAAAMLSKVQDCVGRQQ